MIFSNPGLAQLTRTKCHLFDADEPGDSTWLQPCYVYAHLLLTILQNSDHCQQCFLLHKYMYQHLMIQLLL